MRVRIAAEKKHKEAHVCIKISMLDSDSVGQPHCEQSADDRCQHVEIHGHKSVKKGSSCTAHGHLAVELELALWGAADDSHPLAGAVKF